MRKEGTNSDNNNIKERGRDRGSTRSNNREQRKRGKVSRKSIYI